MRTSKSERGSAAVPALLALLQVILVVVTVYVFAADFPWNHPPAPINEVGRAVDQQYKMTLVVTATVFILSQLGLAFAVFAYRDHGQKVQFTRGNNTMEIMWTTATIILFLGLGVMGRRAWAEVRFTPAAADAIQVEVTENQFVFNFRYPGPDGKFGRLDPKQISASTGNPLGIDSNDPAGKDDIVVPTLTVPVNHEVELHVTSQDVIHNIFVREMRLQQDAVPGLVVPVHFTAEKIGQYEIVCTQLCGLGHSRMHSYLNVVSDADFQQFLKSGGQ